MLEMCSIATKPCTALGWPSDLENPRAKLAKLWAHRIPVSESLAAP